MKACRSFGGRGKNGSAWQSGRLLHALGKRNPGDGPGRLVIFPAGTRDVSPYDGFYRQGLQPLYHECAAGYLLTLVLCHDRFGCNAGKVIGNDVIQLFKPEAG